MSSVSLTPINKSSTPSLVAINKSSRVVFLITDDGAFIVDDNTTPYKYIVIKDTDTVSGIAKS